MLEMFAERDLIHLDPVYQRASRLWDMRRQQLLIDSIINRFELPKLYLHELLPSQQIEKSAYRYAIIDGKQRLLAMWDFMLNEFPLAQDFKLFDDPAIDAGGLRYEDLSNRFPHLLARFNATDLPVVVMRTSDSELVEILFTRLNEAVSLSAPEFRNAMGGPLPSEFRGLERHPFFYESMRINNNRYQHLDVAAKFLFILYRNGFVSTKKKDLDEFVRHFKLGRDNHEPFASERAVRRLEDTARAILDAMTDFFRPRDPLLKNVGWITLFFHLFRITGRDPRGLGLHRDHFDTFFERLVETRAILRQITKEGASLDGGPDPTLQQFVNLGQSSNDGSAILGRYTIVRQYLQDEFEIALPVPEESH